MSALTAARTQKYRTGDMMDLRVGTDVVYQGGMAMQSAGVIVAGADTASCTFVGVAAQTVDNSAGAADKYISVFRRGIFSLAAASAAEATWVGQKMFIVDDQTVALAGTPTNDVYVGICVKVVSATEVLVDIDTLSIA